MLGNYDQCLNTSVFKKNGSLDFRGQYCLVSFSPYLPKKEITPDDNDRLLLVERITQNFTEPIRLITTLSERLRYKSFSFGLCVPSGCDTNDVDKLIKYAGKQVLMNLTLGYCDTEDTLMYFSPRRIVVTFIFSFIILITFIASVTEQYAKKNKTEFHNRALKCLICFSIPANFPKFMCTKETEKKLSCLSGIRVLSLFYVILTHHYLLKIDVFQVRNAYSGLLNWVSQFLFQIVCNGVFSVEVFFFIGGFLNCYFRAKKNFTSFSISSSILFFVHRLWRIYPALIASILLCFLFNARGPMAHFVETKYLSPCATEWWRNLLFINNIDADLSQCFPHTWYIACDMQYFLISLFTIPLLFKKPKIGILVNLAIIFSAMLLTSIWVWIKRLPPTFVIHNGSETALMYTLKVFFSPLPHAASYFAGVLFGFFMIKKSSLSISKITQIFGWIIASTTFLTMLFVTYKWNSGTPYTRLESVLYFSFSRPLYSMSVGWLMFCCITGHGGVINYILSLKLWIPLNRLCLFAYLLSTPLQMLFYANLRTPMDIQSELEIFEYLAEIAASCLLSFAMVLLFESPFIGLEKIIFYNRTNGSKDKDNEMNENDIIQNINYTKSDKDENSVKIENSFEMKPNGQTKTSQ